MAIILVMSETLPLATVKARFSEIVDRVARQQDRVIVTRNGQPAAVLVSTEDLESLEETLAIMSDRSLTAQIRESEKAAARGETGAELDELRASLEQRRTRHK
jgi:prevent-host-death family protein